MQSLSATRLLDLWERGRALPPVEQAVLLLDAAHPDLSAADVAQLSIGRRDRLVLGLRARIFGRELSSYVPCPACGEGLEFALAVDDLASGPDEPVEATVGPQRDSLRVGDYEIHFRLPNSKDLVALTAGQHEGPARQALLERCTIEIRQNGERRTVSDLPPDVQAAIVERMAEADPLADVQMAFTCPACGHAWHATFDIVSYFWSEIDAWARRTLAQVHALASAYGWGESEVLSLSAWRREQYLELIHG
jgi:hypothetical protein